MKDDHRNPQKATNSDGASKSIRPRAARIFATGSSLAAALLPRAHAQTLIYENRHRLSRLCAAQRRPIADPAGPGGLTLGVIPVGGNVSLRFDCIAQ